MNIRHALAGLLAALQTLTVSDLRDERGDVPGWVMITLMSAALVVGILAIAAPALQDMFQQAMDQVTGAAGRG